jgi:hypothetical protein
MTQHVECIQERAADMTLAGQLFLLRLPRESHISCPFLYTFHMLGHDQIRYLKQRKLKLTMHYVLDST